MVTRVSLCVVGLALLCGCEPATQPPPEPANEPAPSNAGAPTSPSDADHDHSDHDHSDHDHSDHDHSDHDHADHTPGDADQPATEPPGPLAAELNAMAEGAKARLPADMLATFEQGIRDVDASGVVAGAIKVGDLAPPFELPDAHGNTVSLASLVAEGPVVLTWYRGGWCPYCNIALRGMQARLPEFRALGATLVAISPELPDHSLATAQAQQLEFTVLSDTASTAARAFGIAYALPEVIRPAYSGLDLPARNGDPSLVLPLSATYVIDREGVVRWAFADADYRKRAEPEDVLAALRALGGS